MDSLSCRNDGKKEKNNSNRKRISLLIIDCIQNVGLRMPTVFYPGFVDRADNLVRF